MPPRDSSYMELAGFEPYYLGPLINKAFKAVFAISKTKVNAILNAITPKFA